jgi:hypothetical protein
VYVPAHHRSAVISSPPNRAGVVARRYVMPVEPTEAAEEAEPVVRFDPFAPFTPFTPLASLASFVRFVSCVSCVPFASRVSLPRFVSLTSFMLFVSLVLLMTFVSLMPSSSAVRPGKPKSSWVHGSCGDPAYVDGVRRSLRCVLRQRTPGKTGRRDMEGGPRVSSWGRTFPETDPSGAGELSGVSRERDGIGHQLRAVQGHLTQHTDRGPRLSDGREHRTAAAHARRRSGKCEEK